MLLHKDIKMKTRKPS